MHGRVHHRPDAHKRSLMSQIPVSSNLMHVQTIPQVFTPESDIRDHEHEKSDDPFDTSHYTHGQKKNRTDLSRTEASVERRYVPFAAVDIGFAAVACAKEHFSKSEKKLNARSGNLRVHRRLPFSVVEPSKTHVSRVSRCTEQTRTNGIGVYDCRTRVHSVRDRVCRSLCKGLTTHVRVSPTGPQTGRQADRSEGLQWVLAM